MQYMQFGCPTSHNGKIGNTISPQNWKGATENPSDNLQYLDTELNNTSMLPFLENIFDEAA